MILVIQLIRKQNNLTLLLYVVFIFIFLIYLFSHTFQQCCKIKKKLFNIIMRLYK